MIPKSKTIHKSDESFPPKVLSAIRAARREIIRGGIKFKRFLPFSTKLCNIWSYEYSPSTGCEIRIPHWSLGMSEKFIKDVQNMDGKMRGRILNSLMDIAHNPIKPKGDTIKPFTHIKGTWRYRIGDYRLIYSPDQEKKQIALLAFESRGGGYD